VCKTDGQTQAFDNMLLKNSSNTLFITKLIKTIFLFYKIRKLDFFGSEGERQTNLRPCKD
jgi:hypothetical protein